jgi:hypothetical protein
VHFSYCKERDYDGVGVSLACSKKNGFVLLITFHALHDYECCRKKMAQCTAVMECLEYDLPDIIGVIRVFFSVFLDFLCFFVSSSSRLGLLCRHSFHFQETVRCWLSGSPEGFLSF